MTGLPSRRDSVTRILNAISDGSDFPSLSACIQEVMKQVEDEVSVQHMTNVILKDISMTLRVLRTANSPYYNRSGRPILSISHAVAMLGVDSVRDLAGSLVLFEHFQRKSPGLKELILLSLLSANHAREVAERVRYPRREEAYLCGMFRNLGELVAAAYRGQEYQEVLRRMRQDRLSDSQACLQVLQCTYEELGEAVATHWKLPETVRDSLSGPLPPLAKRRYSEAEMLRVVAGFAHRLTTAVYRRETRAARASVNLLLDNYGLILGVRHDDIRRIAEAALRETRETFHVARVPLDDLRFQKQSAAVLASADESADKIAAGEMRRPEEVLAELAAEAEACLDADGDLDLNQFVVLLMEAICRGGPFDRVLFALTDTAAGELRGKVGLGKNLEDLLSRFVFPLSVQTGTVSIALHRKQDVYVAQTREGRYESDIVKRTGAACFGLYPVVVEGVAVGCLYFDRLPSGDAAAAKPLDISSFSVLKKLRDLLAAAIRRRTGSDALFGLGPHAMPRHSRRTG